MRMSRRIALYGPKRDLILFDAAKGGDMTAMTGGWTHSGRNGGNAEILDTYIHFRHTRNDSATPEANAQTAHKIDLSDLTTLAFICTRSTNTGYGTVFLEVWNDTSRQARVSCGNGTAEQTVSLDVSSFTGKYYIKFVLNGGKNVSFAIDTYITKVWGER